MTKDFKEGALWALRWAARNPIGRMWYEVPFDGPSESTKEFVARGEKVLKRKLAKKRVV